MIYLMNINTGSVDTEENWRADFDSMSQEEWGSRCFADGMLVHVEKSDTGDWVEVRGG